MEDKSQEIGVVQVHNVVLAQIIRAAVDKVDGAHLYRSGSFWSKILSIFDKSAAEGLSIRVDSTNNFTVKVNLAVRYGLNVNDTAKLVQNQIKEDILKSVTINIKTIDIRVWSIERGK
ncbi:MAG: Asp23/Gls24 family envelope stress response protein [Candidatus Omnitrophica bacterium]|nr:Asp23/Gls24 family envelope stress response protein [Candidatus Omnitrophota bacterium]